MKPTISIIGGTGKMGSLFARAFRRKGYKVLIAGRKTKLSMIEAAQRGDVVIITVPIRETVKIIRKIGPHVRKDALLTDFTSVKVKPVKAMKKYSKAQVLGGHPMFGPTAALKNQNYVLCPARGRKYVNWYKSLLRSLGLNVIITTPEKHDKMMAVIQCLTHFSNLVFSDTLRKLKHNLALADTIATPTYWLRIHTVGRMLAQDASLYADIQAENPYAAKVAKVYAQSAARLAKCISKGVGFQKVFESSQTYFKKRTAASLRITKELIRQMK